jgi:NADPH:quinone reductase-like Zn-dependent oxidoreductase
LAAGRTITAALDPVGGRLAADLFGLLSPGGTLVAYSALADEPIPVHAATLLGSALAIRGATISRWVTMTSPQQRAWDIATAVFIAQDFGHAFVVAGHYRVADIGAAADHAVRPGKAGTALVEFD